MTACLFVCVCVCGVCCVYVSVYASVYVSGCEWMCVCVNWTQEAAHYGWLCLCVRALFFREYSAPAGPARQA